MDQETAKKIAIDKVISICAEVGIKYRRIDFAKADKTLDNGTMVCVRKDDVTIKLLFDGEKHGKELKKKKQEFYKYFNCRVGAGGIWFEFTMKELEIDAIKEDVDEKKLEEVMEKIKKLLALSQSDNEHEAISASLMAQKLLAKYNIDIASVNGEEKEQQCEEIRADVETGNKWKYNLANIIAKNYRCKCYYHGAEMIVFYGYRQDIIIARSVYMYLFNVCKRLGRAYERKMRETRYTAEGVYNSYCAGFISGVDSELSKQCRELMIITPQKVEDGFKARAAKFGTKNTDIGISTFHGGAYTAGVKEGKNALNARYVEDKSGYIEEEQ